MKPRHLVLSVAGFVALCGVVFFKGVGPPLGGAVPVFASGPQNGEAREVHEDQEPGHPRQNEEEADGEGAGGEKAPSWIRHDQGGTFVELDSETQSRIGLHVEPIKTHVLQREMIAYGLLEEDPVESFTLRAPFPGYISAGAVEWPRVGTHVEAGTKLASLKVRLTAAERLDIHSRWLDAQGEIQELRAGLEADRASFVNKKKLNEEGGVVSDRALELAETKVRVDEARLEAAREREALLARLVGENVKRIESVALVAESAGDVVEVAAQPGEVVESGQMLLRLSKLDRLIARIELPLGESFNALTGRARIVSIGDSRNVFESHLLGAAPAAGMQTGGPALLFQVHVPNALARPGTPVAAYLSQAGARMAGVLIPRSAVLRFAGSMRVYLQTGEQRFESRDFSNAVPTEEGWFVAAGLSPGDRVVIQGAQELLSEALKSQIEQEEELDE